MDPSIKLDLAEDLGEKVLEDITDNEAVVGSLMYAALATQPGISYAVAAPSRYNSQPFTSFITTAKIVVQYLTSTADSWQHFNWIDIANSFVGYSDSNWANGRTDRKSQGGHVFVTNDGYIVWQSRKQSVIPMATLEAEFITCLGASGEVKWLL